MGVWGPGSSSCLDVADWVVGGLAIVLLLSLSVVLSARWTRVQIARRFDRRIAELYEAIRAKAEAARDADYRQVPAEAFALYHALREELFELAGLGGAVQTLKDAVVRAAAQVSASAASQPRPVKGAAISPRLPPPESFPPDAIPPDPHAALRSAVQDFWVYWSNRQRVERQLRQVVRNLGGELALSEAPARRRDIFRLRLSPAGSRPRASSPARPRSRPASP